jgi:hypothetical protein
MARMSIVENPVCRFPPHRHPNCHPLASRMRWSARQATIGGSPGMGLGEAMASGSRHLLEKSRAWACRPCLNPKQYSSRLAKTAARHRYVWKERLELACRSLAWHPRVQTARCSSASRSFRRLIGPVSPVPGSTVSAAVHTNLQTAAVEAVSRALWKLAIGWDRIRNWPTAQCPDCSASSQIHRNQDCPSSTPGPRHFLEGRPACRYPKP